MTLALLVGIIAALTLTGAIWLQYGRMEWLLGTGKVTLRRRFREHVVEKFQGATLVLEETSDSDGDSWYTLSTMDASGDKKTIHSCLHAVQEPQQLAEWLSTKTKMPFNNQVQNPKDKAREFADMIAKLEKTGKFGQWMAKRLTAKPSKT